MTKPSNDLTTLKKIQKPLANLPSVFDHIDDIISKVKASDTIFCFDYDGTLTPIVEDYEKAFLPEEMRATLTLLATKIPVAVVSGRDLSFIKKNVGLDEVYYAGSHGFEIEGPNDYAYEVEEGVALLPVLDEIENLLRSKLAEIKGSDVERKKYAIAIHYRHVAEDQVDFVKRTVELITETYQTVKIGKGKMILEIKPNIDWHKGKAVNVLCEKLKSGENPAIAYYIGDDITDEDAFSVLTEGSGIMVGEHDEETYSDYHLDTVADVKVFLDKLIEQL